MFRQAGQACLERPWTVTKEISTSEIMAKLVLYFYLFRCSLNRMKARFIPAAFQPFQLPAKCQGMNFGIAPRSPFLDDQMVLHVTPRHWRWEWPTWSNLIISKSARIQQHIIECGIQYYIYGDKSDLEIDVFLTLYRGWGGRTATLRRSRALRSPAELVGRSGGHNPCLRIMCHPQGNKIAIENRHL